MVARLLPASNKRFTISICPFVAAVCRAVVFDKSTVIDNSGWASIRSLNISVKIQTQTQTSFPEENEQMENSKI
jgi:hypothetical protein